MLPEGFQLNGKYTVKKHIASGGFGSTYLVIQNDNNQMLAAKELFIKGVNQRDGIGKVIVTEQANIKLFNSQRDKFMREATTLLAIDNNNVVRVYDCFLQNNTAYYVMEFVDGMTLAQKVKTQGKLEEKEAISIFVHILNALFAIHRQKVLHLDIKPANIMIDAKGNVKIIDFGTAKIINDDPDTIATFTPVYAPTELQQQDMKNIGTWTDIFSLGATLYFMLTATKPPTSADIIQMKERAFFFPENITDITKSLIIWMMKPEMALRPQSVGQVISFMETGKMPILNTTNGQTDDNTTETIYVKPGVTTQTTDRRRNPTKTMTDIKDQKESTGAGGCFWTFIIVLMLLIAAGFFLYKAGYIDSFIREYVDKGKDIIPDGKNTPEVNDANIKNLELDYFYKWCELIDNAKADIMYAQDVDNLQKIIDIYQRNVDYMKSEYQNIQLPTALQSIVDDKTKQLNDKIADKLEEINNQVVVAQPDENIMEMGNASDEESLGGQQMNHTDNISPQERQAENKQSEQQGEINDTVAEDAEQPATETIEGAEE